jgi:hypothetical protein
VRTHAKASSAASTQREFEATAGSARRPLVALAATVLASLVALTAIAAAAPPEYLTSFGPDGTATSDFDRLSSVAVDRQTGDVYVLDRGAGSLYKFDAEGQPVDWGGSASYISGNRIDGLSPDDSEGYLRSQVAVDSGSHVVYVTTKQSLRAFQADGEPAEFTAGSGMGTNEIPGFTRLEGVAVDANAAIYTSDSEAGTVSVHSADGAFLTSFANQHSRNLAVASSGAVYVASGYPNGGVHKFVPDSYPVTGSTIYTPGTKLTFSYDPIGVGVDPITDDLYVIVDNFFDTYIRKYDSSGNFVRSIGEPGTPSDSEGFGNLATGIAIAGVGNDLKLYVGNGEDDRFGKGKEIFSRVDIFGTNIVEGPPAVASISSVDVTADSATLRAFVNPNTAQTTYRFEYGPEDCSISACSSVPVGGATIAAGFEPVAVTQAIAGLQPGTAYHFRLVAENSFGTTEAAGTFTTQKSGLGFRLADRRAWEMVSPPNKHGGELVGPVASLIQAAADGNGIVYASKDSIEAFPDGSRIIEPATALARRGPQGWRSKDLAQPNYRVRPYASDPGEYKLFTPDLARAIMDPRDDTGLSPQASERTPYLRENTEPPTYTPLVTGKEGFANVPPGTVFGGDPEATRSRVSVAGASPDLSHVVLLSEVPLVEGAPDGALYLWRDGQLAPVSVLPAGEIVSQSFLGSERVTLQNAVSADGSRVFWQTGLSGSVNGTDLSALYLRDTLAEETIRLDIPRPEASGAGESRPTFQGASADGTVVFFSDSQQLTEDASPSGRDLYRCEIPPGPAPSGCATLTDLSAPIEGSGDSAEVQGLASGVSQDATRIYFVAKGVLDSEPNGLGESAEAGGFNLYLWQQGAGVRFIATLDEGDAAAWGRGGGGPGYTYSLNTATSPSGRYLSFMSQRSLSGQPNLEATSAEAVQEVFAYDAAQDSLACVSCNPSNAAPEGEATKAWRSLVDPRSFWQDRWLAAALPQMQRIVGDAVLHRRRIVFDSGRVLFNAFDSLVPTDSNGQWDVYQWEPTGVGDCTASSAGAGIARSAGGCVSLLSSGTAAEEAGFLDASASGEDVFFLTTARLSVTDEDGELDVYDARVDGEPARLAPRSECQGEACQPPAIPPLDPTPASAAFEGPGNLAPQGTKRCAKGKRRARRQGKVRCVSRKKQRKARAGQKRRAGR